MREVLRKDDDPASWRDRAWLAAMVGAWLAWHVPLMYRTCPGQDEDWYGVPGIAILRGGVPRIPYIPSRDPSTVCYGADVALYALPPLSFYLQALAHLIFGDGIGPARLAASMAGLLAAHLVYDLTLLWFHDHRGAILATASYLLSRAFLFPATTARPDMAAVACGLLAVRFAVEYRRAPRPRSAIVAGLSSGLSLLSHPFGVVPAIQSGIAILAAPASSRRRVRDGACCAAMALGIFALWGPWIAMHPDLFRIQFGGNVLGRAGPGLGKTLTEPLAVLGFQARQALDFLGPSQSAWNLLGVAWALVRARRGVGREFLAHFGAAAFLLALFEGRHPTLGYYAYPAAFGSIAVGMLASDLTTYFERLLPRAIAPAAASALLLLGLLPGAGLRTLWAHARHWKDLNYDARVVARAIMADIPPGSLVAADGSFVLDFYLAGRRVVEAIVNPFSYDVRDEPFEFAVFGRDGLEKYRPRIEGLTLIRTYGDRSDPFATYAELYRRGPDPWPSRSGGARPGPRSPRSAQGTGLPARW